MGFVNATHAEGSAVTSLAVTIPSGAAAGDILVAFVRQNEDAATVTGPGGWTAFANGTVGSSPISRLSGWTAAGNVANLTFNFNAATDVSIDVLAYTGVTGVDNGALGQTTDSSSGTSVTAPALTPGSASTIYVAGFSARQGSGPTTSPPGSMTKRSDDSFPTILSCADETIAGTSSTGTRAATLSNANLNRLAAAVLLTLAPTSRVARTISQFTGFF